MAGRKSTQRTASDADGGWHDYGTNPTGPHRPAEQPKQTKRSEDESVANVRNEQVKRLVAAGASSSDAQALVDEHGADELVAQSNDALEALVDRARASSGVDMSTIDSALGWVDEASDDADQVNRARIVLELEEARRKPRRGVLDPLRALLEASTADPAEQPATPAPGAEIINADGSKQVATSDPENSGDSSDKSDDPVVLNVDVPEATIKQVLADVGDDPRKARAALQAEQSRPSGEARPTLVDKLTEIAGE